MNQCLLSSGRADPARSSSSESNAQQYEQSKRLARSLTQTLFSSVEDRANQQDCTHHTAGRKDSVDCAGYRSCERRAPQQGFVEPSSRDTPQVCGRPGPPSRQACLANHTEMAKVVWTEEVLEDTSSIDDKIHSECVVGSPYVDV